ncbi:leucine-rich repeat protein [Agathobaculum sp. LCP25S3_E8]|uniref:leucine-rich repeat protein n=1 Tax=Agathobaculum sp. LCP25S3_E8 TaxID=3438735 RepID=UPI003F90C3E2
MKRSILRLFTLLFSFAAILTMSTPAFAADYTYPVNGGAELVFDPITGTIKDVKNSSKLVDIDIPEEIYDIPVTTIGKNAFAYCRNVIRVTLPDTITSIEKNAFSYCNSLTSISIPSSVTSIGESAFSSCENLASITIPGSVQRLEKSTFGNCETLSEVTLLEGIQAIDTSAFRDCDLLQEIRFPNSVTEVSTTYTSASLKSLKKITFGTNLQTIGNKSFRLAHNLESVYFAGNAPKIGSDIFSTKANVIIYYPANSSGWSTPTWNGYISQPYTTDTGTTTNPNPPTDPDELTPAPPTPSDPEINIFYDVLENAYYFDSVQWAIKNGITSGTTATTFSPDQTCTKAQIITFLWRAYGSPEPTNEYRFADVTSSAYYYKAALWAQENNLETGNHFQGNTACTRGQTVTYLWKLSGEPNDIKTDVEFTDIPPLSALNNAVAWAYEKGVTAGTSETSFSPNETCTRGQIVTFLYRAMA